MNFVMNEIYRFSKMKSQLGYLWDSDIGQDP